MSVYEITLLLNGEEQSKDIVEYNGQQYRKVKRKAAVGELVVVVAKEETWDDYNIGDVYEVNSIFGHFAIVNAQWSDGSDMNILDREYHVLEPIVQSSQAELDQDSVLEVIANLAQEVAELKRNQEELIARMNDLCGGVEDTLDNKNVRVNINSIEIRNSSYLPSSVVHVDADAKIGEVMFEGTFGIPTSMYTNQLGTLEKRLEEALRNG